MALICGFKSQEFIASAHHTVIKPQYWIPASTSIKAEKTGCHAGINRHGISCKALVKLCRDVYKRICLHGTASAALNFLHADEQVERSIFVKRKVGEAVYLTLKLPMVGFQIVSWKPIC